MDQFPPAPFFAMNIQILRSAPDIARSYGWDVSFPSYSGAFFPATSLTDEFISLKNGTMDYGPWSFVFPEQATRGNNISLEILEFSDHSLYQWLLDWKAAIQGDNFTIHLIGEANVARDMIIQRYDLQRSPVKTEMLQVLPTGEITQGFSSEKGGTVPINLSLAVVGVYD